jgi:hypothetical protein
MSLGQVPTSIPKDPLEDVVDKVVAIGGQIKRIHVVQDGYELHIKIPKDYSDGEV